MWYKTWSSSLFVSNSSLDEQHLFYALGISSSILGFSCLPHIGILFFLHLAAGETVNLSALLCMTTGEEEWANLAHFVATLKSQVSLLCSKSPQAQSLEITLIYIHLCVLDWGQQDKGATEDEMFGWHHWLNEHEFEQTPGDSEGQGSLACCSPWGPPKNLSWLSNWTTTNVFHEFIA